MSLTDISPAERNGIERSCDEIAASIDEIGSRSPEKLTDDIIRDAQRPDLATQSDVVEEITIEIKNLRDELNALSDNIETIKDMIVSPADIDEDVVEEEADAVDYIRGNAQVMLNVLLDIANLNGIDENNTTLDMIAENVQYARDAIGDLVKKLDNLRDL